MKKINVLSLFDGISVAQQALIESDIKVKAYFASEVDSYCISITQKNFPKTIQLGDIKNIGHGTIARLQNKMICEIDLLVGGFPCQDLSIAKKDRQGLKGERSGLFWEMIRIHKEVKPKWFVYENVASMKKEWKEEILNEIKNIDKNAYMIEINAALVSAQNRKRVFFTNIPNIQQPKDRGILLKDILEKNAEVDERMVVNGKSFVLTASYNGVIERNSVEKKQRTMVRIAKIGKGGQGDRIYSTEGKSVNLSANGGGRGAKTGLYRIQKEPHGTALDYYNDTIVPNRKAKVLGTNPQSTTAIAGQLVNDNFLIRKLTCVECERLQSLPDKYTEFGLNENHDYGKDYQGKVFSKISNTQRYKCLGNAFNCSVVKHILIKL